MIRGGQESGAKGTGASTGLDEKNIAIEGDLVRDAEAFIKIHQVDAAAEQEVLAVVDGLGVYFVRSRAAAEEGARFEEFYGVAGGAESCRGGESGQAASGDYRFRQGSPAFPPSCLQWGGWRAGVRWGGPVNG